MLPRMLVSNFCSNLSLTVLCIRVDHLADGHRLTLLLLEVIDACTDELQKDIISFLPEVCPENDTEVNPILADLPSFQVVHTYEQCRRCLADSVAQTPGPV